MNPLPVSKLLILHTVKYKPPKYIYTVYIFSMTTKIYESPQNSNMLTEPHDTIVTIELNWLNKGNSFNFQASSLEK